MVKHSKRRSMKMGRSRGRGQRKSMKRGRSRSQRGGWDWPWSEKKDILNGAVANGAVAKKVEITSIPPISEESPLDKVTNFLSDGTNKVEAGLTDLGTQAGTVLDKGVNDGKGMLSGIFGNSTDNVVATPTTGLTQAGIAPTQKQAGLATTQTQAGIAPTPTTGLAPTPTTGLATTPTTGLATTPTTTGSGGKRRRRSKRMKGGKNSLGLTYYATPVSNANVAEPTYMMKYTGGKRRKRTCKRRRPHKCNKSCKKRHHKR